MLLLVKLTRLLKLQISWFSHIVDYCLKLGYPVQMPQPGQHISAYPVGGYGVPEQVPHIQ